MPDTPTESELVKRLRVRADNLSRQVELWGSGDLPMVNLLEEAATALSRAEQDIEALVKVARAAQEHYEKYGALGDLWHALASLPPHLAQQIKEMDR